MFSPSSLNHVYRTVWNEALGAMVAVAENAPGHQGSGGTGAPAVRNRALGALSQLALAVALVWSVAPHAYANPEGGVPIHGQASMASNGNVLTVTTQNGAGTNHSAINWQSFSIPAGSTTQIVQPSAASLSINRVVTNTPSVLFGTLSSNGQVVLVNQAGIAVGSGALVDTAGFTASAVGMTAQDAMVGRLRFAGDGMTNATGALTVQGNIIARGGDVVLIAPNVEMAQTAVVESQGGSVVLAAGQSVEVTGRGLEGITLQVQAPTDQAINLGTLKGDAVGIFAGTLKHSGQIQATQASVEGGRVVLKAIGDAYVEGDGRIDATSTTGKGGHIEVLGNRVAVTDNAVLDASGATGGGTVLVGGDYQGKNHQVQNANVTYVGANAMLKADATDNGQGGKVIVWADDTTRAYGSIRARGGAHGGNGGFVETSGKRYLDVGNATVDTRASGGQSGLWLLDPTNVFIAVDQTAATTAGMSGVDTSIGATGPALFQVGSTLNDSLLTTTQLETALLTTNVEVNTTNAAGGGAGNITVVSNITNAATAPRTLTLKAENDITVMGNITSATNALNVVLNANSDAAGTGAIVMSSGSSIVSNGGDITLGGGTNPLTTAAIGNGFAATSNGVKIASNATLNAGAGNISVRGQGLAGTLGNNSGIELGLGSQILTTTGAISLVGTGGDGAASYGSKYGIYFVDSNIQSSTGSIALTGTGGSNGTISNVGVLLDGGVIGSLTNAPITITGNGGATPTGGLNYGVMLSGGTAGLTVLTANGAVAINGTGTGTSSQGVRAFGNGKTVQVLSTGNAAITLAGVGSGAGASIGLDGSGGAIAIGGASNTGDISFTADGSVQDVVIGTGVTIQSTGKLALNPGTGSTTIGIGSGTGVFNLATNELASFANGFASITVGSANQSGVIDVGTSLFNDNLTLWSAGGIQIGTGTALTSTGNLITLNGGSGGVSGAGVIMADKLQLLSSGAVNLTGGNLVNSMAADMSSSGSLVFKNNQSLQIANVNGTNGIDFSNNAATVSVSALTGNLTVNAPVNAGPMGGGAILLEAQNALALNAAVNSSFNADPGGPVKLVAGTGGISSTAGGAITASALEIISAGGVSLLSPNNDLRMALGSGVLAGSVTGSGFAFSSGSDFGVGTVDGTVGLTVASGDISLIAAGAGKALTITNNVQATTGSVSYVADSLAHNAFTTTDGSPGKFVEVKPYSSSTVIQFSALADAAGYLRLSSSELNFSTPLLKVGNSAMTGNISFEQAVTAVSFPSLSLITGGAISQTTGSTLTVANLNADGAAGVAMGTEANVVTGKLGGRTTTGNFAFKTTGSVVLDQVDINNGITSTSGDISLDVGGAVSEGGSAVLDTAGAVTVTSTTGMALNNNNTASVVALNNLSSGNMSYVANKPGVSMSATNVGAGTISLSNVAASGALAVSNAATGSGNISMVSPGNLTVGTATTSGDVTVTSTGGAIVDGNSSASNLSGAVINLSAATDIAANGYPLEVNPSTRVNAQSSAGSIYLSASGSLPIGLISAPSTVSLSTYGGSIIDANGASNNISAASADLSASSGIGVGDALETQLGSLSANAGMTGDIVIENTGTLSLGALTAGSGGRWLVYAADPSNVLPGAVIANFSHYGDTYASYSNPTEVGNGFIYASAAAAAAVSTPTVVPPEAANPVTAFLENFETALQVQENKEDDKDKVQDALVLEGEICKP